MFLRKVLALAFAGMLAMSACGCAFSSGLAKQEETVSSNSHIGASFEYEGEPVTFVKAHVHETECDYEYKDYIALEFDLSRLSEKNRHYFEDDFFLSDVDIIKKSSSTGFSASYETKLTTDNTCFIVYEYPFNTDRDSIVGTDLAIDVQKGGASTGQSVCKVRCTVDDLDTDSEFLQFMSKLGYYGFNKHGYLII